MKILLNPITNTNQYTGTQRRNKNTANFKGALGKNFVADVAYACQKQLEQARLNGATEKDLDIITKSFFNSLQKLIDFAENRLHKNTILNAYDRNKLCGGYLALQYDNQIYPLCWSGNCTYIDKQGNQLSCDSEYNLLDQSKAVRVKELKADELVQITENLVDSTSFYDYTVNTKIFAMLMPYCTAYDISHGDLDKLKSFVDKYKAMQKELKRINIPKTSYIYQIMPSRLYYKVKKRIKQLEKKPSVLDSLDKWTTAVIDPWKYIHQKYSSVTIPSKQKQLKCKK